MCVGLPITTRPNGWQICRIELVEAHGPGRTGGLQHFAMASANRRVLPYTE